MLGVPELLGLMLAPTDRLCVGVTLTDRDRDDEAVLTGLKLAVYVIGVLLGLGDGTVMNTGTVWIGLALSVALNTTAPSPANDDGVGIGCNTE